MPADPKPDPSKRPSKKEVARRRIAEKRAVEAAARAAQRRRTRTVAGAVGAAAVLVIAVVVAVVVQSSRTTVSASAAVPAHTSDKGTTIVVGKASAPVTVDLYEDLQCPNCKAFEAQDGATMAQLVSAGTVQLHYHPMAFLDSSANGNYSTRALNAAAAVLNAAGTDAFQKFHDLLYAHQPPETGPGLSDAQLYSYAQQAGAGGSAVQEQITARTYGDWTKKETDQASKDGVTGTPTMIIGGQEVQDLSPAGITAAVKAAQNG